MLSLCHSSLGWGQWWVVRVWVVASMWWQHVVAAHLAEGCAPLHLRRRTLGLCALPPRGRGGEVGGGQVRGGQVALRGEAEELEQHARDVDARARERVVALPLLADERGEDVWVGLGLRLG